jgi:pseudouridine-5'-monophosphatase
MQVVWCPHPGLLDALVEGEVNGEVEMDVCRVFGLEMEWCGVLSSRQEFKKRIEEATKGWVKLVFSLESFPYRDYGL